VVDTECWDARSATATTRSKVERLNRTLAPEWAYAASYSTDEARMASAALFAFRAPPLAFVEARLAFACSPASARSSFAALGAVTSLTASFSPSRGVALSLGSRNRRRPRPDTTQRWAHPRVGPTSSNGAR